MVGLDWVELDEGLMAWWRVLQMIDEDSYLGDKIVRRPSKEIGGKKSELDTPLWSEIPLTGDPGYPYHYLKH